MKNCEVIPKKWGNSLGVRLPKEFVEANNIKANQKLRIFILQKNPLKELFGTVSFDKPTQEIMDELRQELYD